jgi:hypothetical protein
MVLSVQLAQPLVIMVQDILFKPPVQYMMLWLQLV